MIKTARTVDEAWEKAGKSRQLEDECSSNTDDDDDNHKDEEEPHDQPGPASLATQPPQVMESMQDAEMNEVVDEERNEDEEKTLLQKLRHLLGEKTILLYGDSVTEELGEKYLKKNNINYEYAEHNVMRGAPPEEINKQVSTPQGQLKDDVKEKLSRVEFVVVSAGKNIMRGNLDEYVALDVRNKMLEPMLREKPADLPSSTYHRQRQFVRGRIRLPRSRRSRAGVPCIQNCQAVRRQTRG